MVMVTSPSCPKQHWADVTLQDIKWRTVGVRGRQEHLRGVQEIHGERGESTGAVRGTEPAPAVQLPTPPGTRAPILDSGEA